MPVDSLRVVAAPIQPLEIRIARRDWSYVLCPVEFALLVLVIARRDRGVEPTTRDPNVSRLHPPNSRVRRDDMKRVEPPRVERCLRSMQRKLLVLLAAVAATFVASAPAFAKGPSEGTIEGTGLAGPIAIEWGEGTPGGDRLIDDVGFFPSVFQTTPDPMLDGAPTSDVGPEFTLRWVIPGPGDEAGEIVQLLYPYADGGPLVYTEPGQPVFPSGHTRGGWFRSPDRLVTTLQDLGVPDERALVARSNEASTWWVPASAILAVMTLVGAGLVLISRRRIGELRVEPDGAEVAAAAS